MKNAENKKAARGWAAPLQSDSNAGSEFALGYAASGLRGKVTRKTKIKIGGKTIHCLLSYEAFAICQRRPSTSLTARHGQVGRLLNRVLRFPIFRLFISP
jgi:hypothetical protein